MSVKVFTIRVTYEGCENIIWREYQVSSNCTLAQLGYLILTSFDTMCYHMFEFEYMNKKYVMDQDDYDYLPEDTDCGILKKTKLNSLELSVGSNMSMTYDLGCCQEFSAVVTAIADMQPHHGRSYPKVVAGESKGIIDDMPADALMDEIKKIDKTDKCSFVYPGFKDCEKIWDYRDYDAELDDLGIRDFVRMTQDNYENY